ncbi:hypothetical protein NDU88_003253 [Pleurodeles waltl]|uniref:Uncharacterized protein n=1 Tax=Pleurodeles waltl TaxID=8319 RepID=A0AAV7WNX6_PLEWA|nr:hypothetical protein NDU88_003253 [Pleurodeles waltl]
MWVTMNSRSKELHEPEVVQLFLDSLQDGAMKTSLDTTDSSTTAQGLLPLEHADRLSRGFRVMDRLNRKQRGRKKAVKVVLELMQDRGIDNS